MGIELIYPPTLLLLGLLALAFLATVAGLLLTERRGATAGSRSHPPPASAPATVTRPGSASSAGQPAWMDRQVLQPDEAAFSRLAGTVLGRGFTLQAQGPGEDPELATYARDDIRVAYRHHPATGLRLLEVKDPAGRAAALTAELLGAAGLRTVDRATVSTWLGSDEAPDPLRALQALDFLAGGLAAAGPGSLTDAERQRLEALADHPRSEVAAEARRLRLSLGG